MSMTYTLLRERLEKVENIEHILKLFKVTMENNIVRLSQDCKIEEYYCGQPYDEWSDSEQEEFKYKWKEISSECIFNLYSEMGWNISELAEGKRILKSSDGDPYVSYYLSEAWSKIRELNDDFEFFYAVLALVQGIRNNEKQELYRYIRYPTEKFLKDYNLHNILEEKELRNVFIAMSFDEKMNKAKEIITKVIKNSGYNPMIMDMKEHNNQIVPEIFYEIKRSKFVVADLTQHKTGVYYEVGYADALEKQIILTCKNTDFKKTHFDISQKNIIKWDDEKDLEKRLGNRIKTTIGNLYL